VTVKWEVAGVAAAAGVGAKPNVKHPNRAAGSTDLTVFDNFIFEVTPRELILILARL
jgi:hypothetical protein